MGKRITFKEMVNRCVGKYGNKFDYSSAEEGFRTISTVVKINCPKHGQLNISMKNHFDSGHGCRACGYESNIGIFRKSSDDFVKESLLKHGDVYDYSNVDYKTAKDKVEIICKEHGSFWKTPEHHLRGQGCPKCSGANIDKVNKKRHEDVKRDFVKRCRSVHGNDFEYLEGYTYHDVKVLIKCNRCNNTFKQKPHNHLSGHGCPHCMMSKGEKIIEKWMVSNGIKFESQKWFKDCRGKRRPLPFDFWVEGENTLIEYQGRQHYEPVDFSHSGDKELVMEGFRNINTSDSIKREYCLKEGIKLIEIAYWDIDNIEKILDSNLLERR